ncbi:MAG: MASE1 domain-containing protein [Anaerolineae bacterium]|nr:MASE1 domain-containing protein [Anaerolineae bacterium]
MLPMIARLTHWNTSSFSLPQWLLLNFLVCAAYVLSGIFGMNYAVLGGDTVTAMWPPSGIALAAVIIFGPRVLPAATLGSIVINWRLLGVAPTPLAGFLAATTIGIGVALQVGVGRYFVRRYCPSGGIFTTTRGVLVFIFLGALLACVVNATIGATALTLAGLSDISGYPMLWLTWYLGDASGMLIFAPFFIIWITHSISSTRRQTIESLLVVAGLLLVTYITFSNSMPVAFVIIAILGLIAFRYGRHAASASIVLTSILTVYLTGQGLGSFARADLNESVLLLQSFIATTTIPVLLLAAAIREREAFAARLEESNHTLEAKVLERTGQLSAALEAAESASRTKALYIAYMAHEFRTPLVAIAGYSDLLAEGAYGDMLDSQTTAATRITDSAQRLHRLISSTIDLARTEVSALELNLVTLKPRVFVKEIVSELESIARSKGLKLKAQFTPGLPELVRADTLRLQQVAINLVGNALKFTEDGEVILEAGGSGEHDWYFRVSDTGPGIPDGKIPLLFENFRQVHPSPEYTAEGSGLGLAISRQLVTLMGGTIHAESPSGKGAVFTVTLPVGEIPQESK